MEGVGGRANFANTGQLISSHWIKPIDRGSAGESGRFRELKLIRRGVSSFRLRRDPSTRFFRSRRGSLRYDEESPLDPEKLDRLTPVVRVTSRHSDVLLRQHRYRSCPFIFCGNVRNVVAYLDPVTSFSAG